MQNLLPPLLILLVVAAIVVFVLRAGARRSRESLEGALSGGPAAAAAASARLNEAQHRAVYSLIARGLTVQAIAAYREATGSGLVEARNAVILLDRYPQAFRTPGPTPVPEAQPAPQQPAEPVQPPAPVEPAASEQPPAVARRSAAEASGEPARSVEGAPSAGGSRSGGPGEGRPERFPYRYRAIVSNGRQTLEVASNMLNDEIYNEIKSLARIGDAEDAAQMLHRHSDISIEDARAFVALL
ncbi:hypothetical protein J2W21_001882 [Sinomonas atrocyanea]|uniref:hypothetical protein n=1 Tax=Sinomonas atrocyanea TaxID=37927 RepID=UPI002784B1F8|nr:hypothetical protein [Sinomonas atrocyanea]MDP9884372.1 hypothetical protein [Sinomonas atrocyanea]